MAGALAVALLAGCRRGNNVTVEIPTVAVERRDIVLDATASGTVEPMNVVEVKSKSSGQITRMTVETGSMVSPGDLIVQLDTRDVQNQYDQSKADLDAAESACGCPKHRRSARMSSSSSASSRPRARASQLEFANAQAAVVRARTSADIALQRLEDATVRAPIQGTVIEKTVSLGQVITSATSSASGGTTILKMADLTKVRMRAFFNETDIGSVQPGQEATVIVDAYPDRPFRGTVEKIEPQAVVQQSVTMFPVLVTLANREGLLKPGMTGEASVLVDRRDAVLAVPNDAVRSIREGAATAVLLGLNPDSVQAEIQRQTASSFGAAGGGMAGGATNGRATPPSTTPRESRGEVALASLESSSRSRVTDQTAQDSRCVRQTAGRSGQAAGAFPRVRSNEITWSRCAARPRRSTSRRVDGRVARACRC